MTVDVMRDTDEHSHATTRDDVEPDLDVHAPPARSFKYSLMLLAMSVAWAALLGQFGRGNIYWIMGPYAVAMSTVLLTLRSESLLRTLHPNARNVAIGCAVGVAMTVATYPAFWLAQQRFPQLTANVAQLYRQSHDEALVIALLWVVVLAAAEELLWRGAWVEALTARFGALGAGTLSVLIYAGAQLGSRSFIVCLLAICCGAIWTVERYYTRSLVAPLISHLIWTPTTILLFPVT